MRIKLWLLSVGMAAAGMANAAQAANTGATNTTQVPKADMTHAGQVRNAGMANAAQGPSVEYSADAYMETSAMVMQGPAYFAPGKERREYSMEGMKMVTITRRDKKIIWSLMPEEKTYSEMAMPESGGTGDLSGYTFDLTRVGSEKVNGVQTTKNKMIMTGPNGDKLGGFSWITDQGIVVKMDAIAMDKNSKERIKSELKNLKIGHVDASVFEIPDDYTKMDMSMGGIGKMMMGGDEEDNPEADNGKSEEKKPEVQEKKKGFSWKDAIDILK